MFNKLNLLTNLNDDLSNQKKMYQGFSIKMGFETANVLIPIDSAETFEQEMLQIKPKSVTTLTEHVLRYGGIIE